MVSQWDLRACQNRLPIGRDPSAATQSADHRAAYSQNNDRAKAPTAVGRSLDPVRPAWLAPSLRGVPALCLFIRHSIATILHAQPRTPRETVQHQTCVTSGDRPAGRGKPAVGDGGRQAGFHCRVSQKVERALDVPTVCHVAEVTKHPNERLERFDQACL